MVARHGIDLAAFLIKSHFGDIVSRVCECLLNRGTLTFEELVRFIELDPADNGRNSVLIKNCLLVLIQHNCVQAFSVPKNAMRSSLHTSFNLLVHGQYVERCPEPDPFVLPNSVGETTSSKGHGSKRKHEEIEVDNDAPATFTENEIFWRANLKKFVRCLKKKVCVESIRSRFGIDAVTASMDAILEGARGKPGGIQMTLEHVRTILEQIGCCLCIEESGTLYTIDLKGMIEICQNAEIESLVLKRYGKEAYRIFRLLAKDGGKKETDQIADMTVVEKKESQGLLYKLWKDNYLDMEVGNFYSLAS